MRLIDADALKVVIDNLLDSDELGLTEWGAVDTAIDNASTIDPVKHGRWLKTDAWPHHVFCSECYKTYAEYHWKIWIDGSLSRWYCPNCGARMDGDEVDKD